MACRDVIGLGGVGSAATYQQAAVGRRVLGIDQYPLSSGPRSREFPREDSDHHPPGLL